MDTRLLSKLEDLYERFEAEAKTLYLVATPIGNVADISIRALACLNKVDLILAEDTRTSKDLLKQFYIKQDYLSYHKHNYMKRIPEIIELLENNKSLALITDAGMPAVSDPGAEIVSACLDRNIQVKVVPGPSAAIAAMSLSGYQSKEFRFLGFLPLKKKDRDNLFKDIKNYNGINVIYEAPHRIVDTLKNLDAAGFSTRRITICRELSKFYEESFRMTVSEALAYYKENEPRGEFVLVLDQPSQAERQAKKANEISDIKALIKSKLKEGSSNKTIVLEVNEISDLSKNKIKSLIADIRAEEKSKQNE